MLFGEVLKDFNLPTKRSLIAVVDVLERKAGSWGMPDDIITYNQVQIRKKNQYSETADGDDRVSA